MAEVTKSTVEKLLGDVPQDKRFLCQDGRVIKNLHELEIALKDMGEETFRNHANEAKNDFANWVKDVVGDEKLSSDLLKSATRLKSAKKVADRITWLRSKLARAAEWSPLFRPPVWPF